MAPAAETLKSPEGKKFLELAEGSLFLLAFGDGILTSHALPEKGELALGREEGCAICVSHPSVSRKHALLRREKAVTLEDLGSLNGTKVNGVRLQANAPIAVAPGDVIEVGSVTAVFYRPKVLANRRIRTHSELTAEVEAARAESQKSGSAFAVAKIQVLDQISDELLEKCLAEVIQPKDVLARFSPKEYGALLYSVAGKEADRWVRSFCKGLGKHAAGVRVEVDPYSNGRRSGEIVSSKTAIWKRKASDVFLEPIVEDPRLKDLYRLACTVAKSEISVLLLGETGVGKEVFAEVIHRHSSRANGPFLQLNCAALPQSLLESELFGYEKGAFTGAEQNKIGLFESVGGGTLLLDEIGELPQETQVKLLRVLEKREVLPIGALRTRPIDVRIISATNRDLEAACREGAFRRDLFYRLNGMSLTLPPLRDRVAEIEPLAKAFIARAAQAQGRASPPVLSAPASLLLKTYAWPGNIRELRSVIECAVLLCTGDQIGIEHLPVDRMHHALQGTPGAKPPPATAQGKSDAMETLPEAADASDTEREKIKEALLRCGGNQTLAAKFLGISRPTLHARMDAYGIPRPRKTAR